MPRPACPPVAADMIIEIGPQIVLIERQNFPPGWAIPGGFVDFGETVEQAAIREAREETRLEVEIREMLGIYSLPGRDPRGQTISVVYVGTASGDPIANDDAKSICLCDASHPPSPLAFDHALILADYVHFARTGRRPEPWRESKECIRSVEPKATKI